MDYIIRSIKGPLLAAAVWGAVKQRPILTVGGIDAQLAPVSSNVNRANLCVISLASDTQASAKVNLCLYNTRSVCNNGDGFVDLVTDNDLDITVCEGHSAANWMTLI